MIKDKMSAGKQKLRPWLEEMISRGDVSGLCWLNEEKTKFRIPWKHGGKQDWSPDNSRIFMEWAKHTGKYREGVDEPNYPTWKTRLRCAFNKAPDIQEVKEESQLNCHEPFRVYILTHAKRTKLDPKGQKGNGRGGGGGAGGRKGATGGGGGRGEEEDEGGDYNSALKTEFSSDVKEVVDSSGIPTMVSEFDECASQTEDCLSPDDLQGLFASDLLTPDTTCYMLQEVAEDIDLQFDGTFPSDVSTGEPTASLSYLQADSGDKFLALLQNSDCQMDQPNRSPKKDFRIKLELFYCGQLVLQKENNIKSGLRLAVSGCATSLRPDFAILPDPVEDLLANDPPTIYLPLCGNLLNSQRLEPMVNHILTKSLSQGLLLWMNDDCDIFACRFCPGAIYHISQTETNGKPVKIQLNKDRPEVVRIFRFIDGYKRERDRYLAGERDDAPEATIYLSFGQPANTDDIPERVYVCVKITPLGLDDDGFSESTPGVVVNDVEMDESFLYNAAYNIGSCTSSIPCDMEAADNDNDDDNDDNDDDEESQLNDEQ